MRDDAFLSAPVETASTESKDKRQRDAAQVRQLAAAGVPAETIRRLVPCGVRGLPLTAERFNRRFRAALQAGAAEADEKVARVLHELASSGACHQMTLAWAKERLGWGQEENRHATCAGVDAEASGLAALRALLDAVAAEKAGRAGGAEPVAADRAAEPAAAGCS